MYVVRPLTLCVISERRKRIRRLNSNPQLRFFVNSHIIPFITRRCNIFCVLLPWSSSSNCNDIKSQFPRSLTHTHNNSLTCIVTGSTIIATMMMTMTTLTTTTRLQLVNNDTNSGPDLQKLIETCYMVKVRGIWSGQTGKSAATGIVSFAVQPEKHNNNWPL